MSAYLIRRLLYAIPVLIGVNLITFLLFFSVNTPDDMARAHLGTKHISQQAVERWKHQHGYNKPLFYHTDASGINKLIDTLFFTKSIHLFAFKFGLSDAGRNIGYDIGERMWPSLALAVPVLLFGIIIHIIFALMMVLFRSTIIDTGGVFLCIVLMSISALFYIITGQYLIAKLLNLTPISGYNYGLNAVKFLILPVIIAVVSGMGSGSRWYRSLFLEEMNKDYVVTARAKGLSEWKVLYRHVLRNALIPIVTGVVVIIPSLFLGSLLMESFFGIPGLGSYMIDAISQQDYAIVRVMVFVGSIFYIIGLMLTDITYTIVDPRIRLK